MPVHGAVPIGTIPTDRQRTDAYGNPIAPYTPGLDDPETDPNNQDRRGDPHYVYSGGRWLYVSDPSTAAGPASNAPPDPNHVTNVTGQTTWSSPGSAAAFLGIRPTMDANSPGASIDTTQATDDQKRMQALITQLQGQAQTGDGAWQQQLAQSTGQAENSATALGQSQPGMDRMSAATGIANARGADAQRAVGQGNMLRAEQQRQASEQLAGIYGQQQGLDAQQAAAQNAAAQGVDEANAAIRSQNRTNGLGFVGGVGQALESIIVGAGGGGSNGGPVAGKPKVFGDSEVNDTVPAWLSPGEIVIPRSVAQRPDAAEAAADFVRAVKGQPHPSHNFPGGGEVPSFPADTGPTTITAPQGYSVDANGQPQLDDAAGFADVMGLSLHNYGPTAFETGDYDRTRANAISNQALLAQMAAGKGPSVAPQQTQNATDDATAAAMRATANARGGNRTAVGNAAIADTAATEQDAAGKAAATAAGEQRHGTAAAANAMQAQRERDFAFAQAQQQAKWRTAMLNAGVGLQQQAMMRGILGGAGQAAMGVAGMFGNSGSGGDGGGGVHGTGTGSDQANIDSAFNAGDESTSSGGMAGDYSLPDETSATAAHGGEIEDTRAKDFVAALKRRRAA